MNLAQAMKYFPSGCETMIVDALWFVGLAGEWRQQTPATQREPRSHSTQWKRHLG
jgi:hypothetical protein